MDEKRLDDGGEEDTESSASAMRCQLARVDRLQHRPPTSGTNQPVQSDGRAIVVGDLAGRGEIELMVIARDGSWVGRRHNVGLHSAEMPLQAPDLATVRRQRPGIPPASITFGQCLASACGSHSIHCPVPVPASTSSPLPLHYHLTLQSYSSLINALCSLLEYRFPLYTPA